MCFSSSSGEEEDAATESFYHSWATLVCDGLDSQCHNAVRNQLFSMCMELYNLRPRFPFVTLTHISHPTPHGAGRSRLGRASVWPRSKYTYPRTFSCLPFTKRYPRCVCTVSTPRLLNRTHTPRPSTRTPHHTAAAAERPSRPTSGRAH